MHGPAAASHGIASVFDGKKKHRSREIFNVGIGDGVTVLEAKSLRKG
ncbi:MAG: hypothetical protein IPM82_30385 [Saprospiraceae bacterium]|nr:hypothetical protein [Saprospiraceae bacterium]